MSSCRATNAKTPVQVAIDAWHNTQRGYPGNFEDVALAVIAAHEAGRPAAKRFSYVDQANDAWRIIVTWALVREDRKWWDHIAGEWTWSIDCRTQFHSRELANSYRDTSERLVRITTRRRRVVK